MKKVISLLIVAVLLVYGIDSLLAEESDSSIKDNSVISESIISSIGTDTISDDGSTLCGDGNGGGCPG